MKKACIISLTLLLVVLSSRSFAQTKDACVILTDAQINKILGCNMKQQGSGAVKGKYCKHTSADFKSEVVLQWYDWHSEKTAVDMQKLTYDGDKKDVASGKKAGGVYTAVKDFAEGGQYAFVATGEGDIYTNGNVTRLQFVIGAIQFTFDTQGMDKNKVVPKLKEIYAAIKNNK